jgi:hypothetical protein
MNSSRHACRRASNLVTIASHSQPGPHDYLLSSRLTHLCVCTACLLSMNACSLSILPQSHHANATHTQFLPFSAHPPSAPSVSPRAIATHTCMCSTHHSSQLRYYYTLFLINQPASLTQSCSHSSYASAVQHASRAPPLLPIINVMPSELSQPAQPAQWHTAPATPSFSCFHHVSILFWFVFTPPDHHTHPYTTQYDCVQCIDHA